LVGVACSIKPPPSQYFPGFFKPRTKGVTRHFVVEERRITLR
jgi:hypothetical protein